MTALAADRRVTITAGSGRERVGKVAGGAKIYKGSVLAKNPAGFLVVAADTLGLRVVGLAQEQVDNTAGLDGALEVKYLTAVSVKMANDATSPVTQAQLGGGSVVFIKDDQTVQASSARGVVAGLAESIEADGGVMVYLAGEITVGAEDLAAQVETVTTATALSVFARYSLLSPTGAMAMPLPPGRYAGQAKTIRMIGGNAAPVANVAGAYTLDGAARASAQFSAAAAQLDVCWNGAAWQVLGNAGVTLS